MQTSKIKPKVWPCTDMEDKDQKCDHVQIWNLKEAFGHPMLISYGFFLVGAWGGWGCGFSATSLTLRHFFLCLKVMDQNKRGNPFSIAFRKFFPKKSFLFGHLGCFGKFCFSPFLWEGQTPNVKKPINNQSESIGRSSKNIKK